MAPWGSQFHLRNMERAYPLPTRYDLEAAETVIAASTCNGLRFHANRRPSDCCPGFSDSYDCNCGYKYKSCCSRNSDGSCDSCRRWECDTCYSCDKSETNVCLSVECDLDQREVWISTDITVAVEQTWPTGESACSCSNFEIRATQHTSHCLRIQNT